MKRIMSCLLTAGLLLSVTAGVFAEGQQEGSDGEVNISFWHIETLEDGRSGSNRSRTVW